MCHLRQGCGCHLYQQHLAAARAAEVEAIRLRCPRVPGAIIDAASAVPITECEIVQSRGCGTVCGQQVVGCIVGRAEAPHRAVRQPDPQRAGWGNGTLKCSSRVSTHVAMCEDRRNDPSRAVGDGPGFRRDVDDNVGRHRATQQAFPRGIGSVGVVVAGDEVPLDIWKLTHALDGPEQHIEPWMRTVINVARDEYGRCLVLNGEVADAGDDL